MENKKFNIHGTKTGRFAASKPNNSNTMGNREKRLEDALKTIIEWEDFPLTDQTWGNGKRMSYSVVYGSNGERDYMREIARKALKRE